MLQILVLEYNFCCSERKMECLCPKSPNPGGDSSAMNYGEALVMSGYEHRDFPVRKRLQLVKVFCFKIRSYTDFAFGG